MNLKRTGITTLLIFLVAICFSPAFGQTDEETKDWFEKHLNQFSSDYESLPTTKNKKKVLDYFAPDATSNIFVFNVSGTSRVQNGNLKGFEAFMDNIIRSTGITLNYGITEIVDITVRGKFASTVYKVDYEIKEADGIWVKGKETVTMAFEKQGEKWKIVHYTFIQMEDEKLKGTCVCELFLGEAEEEVVAKTIVPSGKSYSTKFDSFEFRVVEGDWIIKVQDHLYKRLKTGPLYLLGDDGETQIGVPNSKRETVLMIIGDDLYKDSCARIKTRK